MTAAPTRPPVAPSSLAERCVNTMLLTILDGDFDAWTAALDRLVDSLGPEPLYTLLLSRANALADALADAGFATDVPALSDLLGPLYGAPHVHAAVTAMAELVAQEADPAALAEHWTTRGNDTERIDAEAFALCLIIVALLGGLATAELDLESGEARPSVLSFLELPEPSPRSADELARARFRRLDRRCCQLLFHHWAHREGLPTLP